MKLFFNESELDGATFGIQDGTCGGDEEQFLSWLKMNYPGLDAEISLTGADLMDGNGDVIEGEEKLWEDFCDSYEFWY